MVKQKMTKGYVITVRSFFSMLLLANEQKLQEDTLTADLENYQALT